jgi:SAM-dependent methyltransferase
MILAPSQSKGLPPGRLGAMTGVDWWRRQRSSFGSAAQAYERGRPTYPEAAVDWLLPAGARRVLDLGAGTGKLTRLLVARGLDVVAVEPSAGMRGEFERVLPGVPVLDGSAERIPLGDGTVDAVLVAQAWHWVDVPAASAEVARVLAPGGLLGLVWNLRDPRDGWVGELERLIAQPTESGGTDMADPVVSPPLGPLERSEISWVSRRTKAEVLDMVASRSYVITLPDARREALLADVRTLLERHPEIAGGRDVPIRYVARCYRAKVTTNAS